MRGRNGSTSAENGNGASSLLTIVGESAQIAGKFKVADSIQIDCEIGGELSVGRQLVISEKGVVKANVQTVGAVIHGIYEGTMVATGEVEIASTGHVSGHIETNSLIIAKGGVFTGNVTKLEDTRVSAAAPPVGDWPVAVRGTQDTATA